MHNRRYYPSNFADKYLGKSTLPSPISSYNSIISNNLRSCNVVNNHVRPKAIYSTGLGKAHDTGFSVFRTLLICRAGKNRFEYIRVDSFWRIEWVVFDSVKFDYTIHILKLPDYKLVLAVDAQNVFSGSWLVCLYVCLFYT